MVDEWMEKEPAPPSISKKHVSMSVHGDKADISDV